MRLDHGALIVVADGEKARFFSNAGTPRELKLDEVGQREIENPPTHQQGTDRPGRFDDVGHGRSAVDDTDWHAQAKEQFIGDLAADLNKDALAGRIKQLVVIAPAKALGQLRQELHQETQACLTADVAKDLTNHKIDDIERILRDA
jgi:protein required for attachment to host cells